MKVAAKKTATKRTATKQTASTKTRGKKTSTKKVTASKARPGTNQRASDGGTPALSTNLHRCLVMLLRHTEPFGAALTRKLKALDPHEDSDEREAAALALVDAVHLSPELLASITELTAVDVDDINLLWPYWDGESDPFPLHSLSELLALANLERLANASALPDPPLDARPLLALPRLRHVEMWDSSFVYRGSQYGQWTNNKARALLEAAGFRLVSPPGTTWVFTRG